MKRILFSWIGDRDLLAPWSDAKLRGTRVTGPGPIARVANDLDIDEILLLCDQTRDIGDTYVEWLRKKVSASVTLKIVGLPESNPFGTIYENAVSSLESTPQDPETTFYFNLGSGTPPMIAIWILLAKTRFQAELVEAQHDETRVVEVPFEISADYVPDLLRQSDEDLVRLSQGLPPESPEFEEIIHRSPQMQRLIARARHVAPRLVPVLILGESGTGKDLLARAIHKAGPFPDGPFIPVNCGAIPDELVESEFFGHEKGAFTGATQTHQGFIESAHNGTLFLDEIGELPLHVQVKLLRVLQDKRVTRVGSTESRAVEFRVISATNRNLLQEVAEGNFREDVFHRLAVAILSVPPLREREGDVGLLIDRLLEKVNDDARGQPGYQAKTLSVGARSLLTAYHWPGNVRELQNTILRAAIWTSRKLIRETDINDALLPVYRAAHSGVLDRPLGNGFKLQDTLDEVSRHYLQRALKESGGNKSRAADLVGLSNYQTFTNWIGKLEASSKQAS